jgi:hypothetical protein
MAYSKDVIAGLVILESFVADQEVQANHDEILAGGPPPNSFTTKVREKLESHGWRYDEEQECWRKFT